jgi:hypothetical protein
MPPLAAVTPADLCVAAGPVCAWGLYRLGGHMTWDSPGSPAILVVIAALGGALLMSVTAWITLAIQVARWRRHAPRSTGAAANANALRVAGAIVTTVSMLFYAWLDYRSRRPSHGTLRTPERSSE